jgi:SAM-dependent methyltransferase
MSIVYNEELSKNYNSFHFRNKFQIDIIKFLLNIKKEDRILDVGCGSGRLLKEFNRQGYYVDGVEYSENMFNELNSVDYQQPKPSLYHDDYNNFVSQTELNCDSVYFSYSLHQISPNKETQINLLKKTFENLKCKRILLITSSEMQFNESILNKNSKKLNEIDHSRFLFKNELEKHFNVTYYLEESDLFSIF